MDAPVTTTITLAGLPTSILCQRFSDRVFLIVSQLPAFGALLEAKMEPRMDGTEAQSVRVLLGPRDDDFAALCARRLLECLRVPAPGLPLLLALGLRTPADMDLVKELVAAVEALQPWGGQPGGG